VRHRRHPSAPAAALAVRGGVDAGLALGAVATGRLGAVPAGASRAVQHRRAFRRAPDKLRAVVGVKLVLAEPALHHAAGHDADLAVGALGVPGAALPGPGHPHEAFLAVTRLAGPLELVRLAAAAAPDFEAVAADLEAVAVRLARAAAIFFAAAA